MHRWGEKDFDWSGLNKAIQSLDQICTRWGRIGITSKEKFGTARIYTDFWRGTLHELLFPGHIRLRYSKNQRIFHLLFTLDQRVLPWVAAKTGLRWLVFRWQRLIYAYAYRRNLQKFPHLWHEIAVMADYPEYFLSKKDLKNVYDSDDA